jgi:hypothetical protein
MVAFNINKFRSQIDQKDLLRNNKFVFRVNIPTGLVGLSEQFQNINYRETARSLLYYCEAATQPSMSINAYHERKWGYGPRERRPTVTEYNDTRITFFEDGQSDNFRFFYDWLRLINNGNHYRYEGEVGSVENQTNGFNRPASPYELSYRDEYAVDADLFIFDNTGNPSRQIHFNELYPMALEEAPVSWADNNSLLRLGVNFSFKEWYAVKTVSEFIPERQNIRRTVPAWMRDIQDRFFNKADTPPLPTKNPFPEPLG